MDLSWKLFCSVDLSQYKNCGNCVNWFLFNYWHCWHIVYGAEPVTWSCVRPSVHLSVHVVLDRCYYIGLHGLSMDLCINTTTEVHGLSHHATAAPMCGGFAVERRAYTISGAVALATARYSAANVGSVTFTADVGNGIRNWSQSCFCNHCLFEGGRAGVRGL